MMKVGQSVFSSGLLMALVLQACGQDQAVAPPFQEPVEPPEIEVPEGPGQVLFELQDRDLTPEQLGRLVGNRIRDLTVPVMAVAEGDLRVSLGLWVSFPIAADSVVSFTITSIRRTEGRTFAYGERPGSSNTLTVGIHPSHVSAQVRRGNQVYTVQWLEEDLYALYAVDLTKLPPDHPPG